MLLIVTNRNWHMPCLTKWKSLTLDDLEGHWQPVLLAILTTAGFLVFVIVIFYSTATSSVSRLQCTLCYLPRHWLSRRQEQDRWILMRLRIWPDSSSSRLAVWSALAARYYIWILMMYIWAHRRFSHCQDHSLSALLWRWHYGVDQKVTPFWYMSVLSDC